MLIQRDVIRYGDDAGTAEDFRVVWVHAGEVVLFDLKAPDTRLTRRSRDEVLADLEDGRAGILPEHGYDKHPNPARLTKAQKDRRDKLMGLIGPLLDRAPDIFDDRVRGKAIADIERKQLATTDKDEKKAFASAKTLHQAFDRFWRHGMSAAAIVPAFDKCGKGKRKPGEAKRGAPVTEGMKVGVNVTKAVEKMFETGLGRYYSSKRIARRKLTLKAAYDMTVGDFFLDTVVDPLTGKVEHPPRAEWAERATRRSASSATGTTVATTCSASGASARAGRNTTRTCAASSARRSPGSWASAAGSRSTPPRSTSAACRRSTAPCR